MREINILHICNDFLGSKVHSNLYIELAKRNISQKIFVPLRSGCSKENGDLLVNSNIEIIYSSLMKKYHRLLFGLKIKYLTRNLEEKVRLNSISLLHATTLFSDGAIALNIYKKYQIPYVVTVRVTDISVFLKYRPDLVGLAAEILSHSSKIIFISESNKEMFFNHRYIKKNASDYRSKSIIISNGIEDFWLDNSCSFGDEVSNRILYVGKFIPRKNVLRLIDAVRRLRTTIPDIELGLVGGGGSEHSAVLKQVQESSWIKFYGPVKDKQLLLNIYRNHNLFAMVSHQETFGLVFIEALSQGLPLVFTKEQGIDGLFSEKIGESVSSTSVDEIAKSIALILLNRKRYDTSVLNLSSYYWASISQKYTEIYFSALN